MGLHHSCQRNANMECLRYKRLGGGGGVRFPRVIISCENYQTLHFKQPDVASGLHQTRGIKDNGGSNRRILNKIFAIFHFGAMWTLAYLFAGKIFVQNIMKVEKTVLWPIINNLLFL